MASLSPTRAPADPGLAQPSPPAGRSRAVWLYVACGLVVALASYLVPASGLAPRWAAKIGLYNGLGLSAVIAIMVGVARHRPTPASPNHRRQPGVRGQSGSTWPAGWWSPWPTTSSRRAAWRPTANRYQASGRSGR